MGRRCSRMLKTTRPDCCSPYCWMTPFPIIVSMLIPSNSTGFRPYLPICFSQFLPTSPTRPATLTFCFRCSSHRQHILAIVDRGLWTVDLRLSFVSRCSLTIMGREPGECGVGPSKKSRKGGACGNLLGRAGEEQQVPFRGTVASSVNQRGLPQRLWSPGMCPTQPPLFSGCAGLSTSLGSSPYPLIKEQVSCRTLRMEGG